MSEQIGEHFCTGCGERHGGSHGKDAEVRIAEIQAKRDIEVAKIERGVIRQETEVAAETEIATTEIEAEAAVAVAAEIGSGASEAEQEPETTAIVVEGPPADEPEPQASIEPAESTAPEPGEPERKRLSYWG